MILCSRPSADASQVRGTFLRIPALRFRPAYMRVAVRRPTKRWRVPSPRARGLHHLLSGRDGVAAATAPASSSFVLAALRALQLDPQAPSPAQVIYQAPDRWSGALRQLEMTDIRGGY